MAPNSRLQKVLPTRPVQKTKDTIRALSPAASDVLFVHREEPQMPSLPAASPGGDTVRIRITRKTSPMQLSSQVAASLSVRGANRASSDGMLQQDIDKLAAEVRALREELGQQEPTVQSVSSGSSDGVFAAWAAAADGAAGVTQLRPAEPKAAKLVTKLGPKPQRIVTKLGPKSTLLSKSGPKPKQPAGKIGEVQSVSKLSSEHDEKSPKVPTPSRKRPHSCPPSPRPLTPPSKPPVSSASAAADLGGPTDGQRPSMLPFRKRLRGKSVKSPQKQAEPQAPVALLLKRLCAAGELEVSPAGPRHVADVTSPKASLEDLQALAGAAGDDELQGEGGGRRQKKGAAKTKDEDEEEDDDLFNEDDDLDDEEAVEFSEEEPSLSEGEDPDADIANEVWKPVGALAWPDVWKSGPCTPKQGDQGFNDYAAECIARAGLGTSKSPFAGLGLRLHQESAAFLLHPDSPIQRLLVDHATGTGKTLVMLRILDSFFDDPRPKVVIFPKDRVCDNFYQELLKWPSRWREFFCFSRPVHGGLAGGVVNWKRRRDEVWDLGNEKIRNEAKRRGCRIEKVVRDLVDSIREVLEMKRVIRAGKIRPKMSQKFRKEHPGAPVPRAPLRAFRYTTAGGGACGLGPDGWPRSPLLKVGFDPEEKNPYSRKIVLMDECHNLVRPTVQYAEQLGRLQDHLFTSNGSVLAAFTGTPVGNDALEGRHLLDAVKGNYASGYCDEGFVSSFHARGSSDFPREVPVQQVPDGVLHEGMFPELVIRHSIHGEALKRYLLKENDFMMIPRLASLPEEKKDARMANYCNLHVHYGAYHTANRDALLRDVKGHAPKFYAIAKAVAKRKEKAVILISREMGYKVLHEVLKKTAKKGGFKVATMDERNDFNDPRRNLRGERFRVLLAETSQAAEGVSFFCVRRVYLADVPARHSDLVQRVSRCVRLGGHKDLPPEEREIRIEMHAAQLPSLLRKGPGALLYRELLNAKDVVSTPGCFLESATNACLEEFKRRKIKTLQELATELQKDEGEKFIELLTETALEQLGETSTCPARPLSMALWRLRRGGDDLAYLEQALCKHVTTADERLLDNLVDKAAELLPPLEAMRLGAVDRPLLASLGDPPRAPPPRSEMVRKRVEQANADLQASLRDPADDDDEEDDDDPEVEKAKMNKEVDDLMEMAGVEVPEEDDDEDYDIDALINGDYEEVGEDDDDADDSNAAADDQDEEENQTDPARGESNFSPSIFAKLGDSEMID